MAAVVSILLGYVDAVYPEIVGTAVAATGYHRQHERLGLVSYPVSDGKAVAVDLCPRL